MSVAYLAVLLFALAGMVILDYRLSLFFRADPARASVVILTGMVFFTAWDLLGISLGIFSRGDTEYMTGLLVAPELPVEELFFLGFLSYLTMNLYLLILRRLRTGTFQPTKAPAQGNTVS